MTCDLASESGNSLISDIDKAFKSNNLASINDNNLCKINSQEESFNTIQAHIKTVTALSFGFLNLTGKFIAKTLGLETDSKSEGENSPVTPNKSVRGSKISEILESLNTDTHGYI